MISEGLKKTDDILRYIITDRYVIGRTAEIVSVFEQLTKVHQQYILGLEDIMDSYLSIPHSKDFIQKILIQTKEELEYFRQKSKELSENLDDDELIPMPPEVINFLNALQNYLSSVSGLFTDYHGKKTDLLDSINLTAFIPEEPNIKRLKTISLKYEFRTETDELIQDDLGYKIYTLHEQVLRDWAGLVLAYEPLKFVWK